MNKILKISFFPIILSGCETTYPTLNQVTKAQASNPTATAGVIEITRISNDPAPELLPRSSKNGKNIVITVRDQTKSGAEALSIVSLRIDSPGKRLLAGPYASGATWADDNAIVFSYLRSKSPALVIQSLDSTGMRFLNPTAYGERDQLPDYSAELSKYTFQTVIGGVSHIAVVDRDGKNFTIFAEGEYPRWSSNSKSIYYQKRIGEFDQIFCLNLRDGSVTQLTSGSFNNNYAAPSPISNLIAFTSNRDGSQHLYTMNTDGSNLTQLTSGQTQEAFPEWINEKEIIFSSDAGAPTANLSSAFNWAYSDIWKVKIKN